MQVSSFKGRVTRDINFPLQAHVFTITDTLLIIRTVLIISNGQNVIVEFFSVVITVVDYNLER